MELMQKDSTFETPLPPGYASWLPQLALLNHPIFNEGPFPRSAIDPSDHDHAFVQALYVVSKHQRFLGEEDYPYWPEDTCESVMFRAMRSMLVAWFEYQDFQIFDSGIDWYDDTHKDSDGGFPARAELCLTPKLRSVPAPAIPLPFSGVSVEMWHQSLIASMIEADYLFGGDWIGLSPQRDYNSLLRLTITPWPPGDTTGDDASARSQDNESGIAKRHGEPINVRITMTQTFRGLVESLYGTVTTSTSNAGGSIGRIVAKGPEQSVDHFPVQIGIDCVLSAFGIAGHVIFPASQVGIGDDIWLWRENNQTSM